MVIAVSLTERTLLESGNRTRIELVCQGESRWVEKSLLAFADVGPERVMLAREARLSRLAKSPFVAGALDEVTDLELRSFRRSYIEGRTLGELYDAKTRPRPSEIFRIVRELLEILASFHELDSGDSLVHGDVTPKNVYLTTSGSVMITDFGLSRLVSEPPLSHDAPRGTERFLAPEVRDGGSPTPASDIHQCALLVEHLLQISLEKTTSLDPRGRDALVAARSRDERDRPTARELARALPR